VRGVPHPILYILKPSCKDSRHITFSAVVSVHTDDYSGPDAKCEEFWHVKLLICVRSAVALAARCDAMPLTVEKQIPLGPSCTGFVEQGAGLSGSSMDVAGLLCCTVQVSFFCSRCAANDWAVATSRAQLFISSPDSPQVTSVLVFYVLWSPGPVRHISENEDVDK